MRTACYKQMKLVVLLLSFFAYVVGISPVLADDLAPELSYEVRPLLSNEQKEMGIDYFYYQVQPNEKKQLSFEIINHAPTKETFHVQVNRAATNSNGFIDYSLADTKASKAMDVDFNQLVQTREQEVVVEGQSKETVTIDVTLPKDLFKGIALGGIYVTKISENHTNTAPSDAESIQLKHKLAYAVAVMLQEEVPYKEGNQLLMQEMKADAVENQAMLRLDLENPKPNVLNNVSMTMDIYRNGDDKVYKTLTKENMSFAPSSVFTLDVPWDRHEMTAGDYQAKITFTSGEEKWIFEKQFSISKDETKQLIEAGSALKDPQNSVQILYALLGILALIILVLVIILLRRKK